ncbi:putative short-chain dehydrogenase [Hypoxylon argillaceum]|nr:putative short-chain dehydrogenase [Hypoxylon argillaceum]KAI1152446.1 putative short-chain dehydrogenase [Nemania diffusa]
MPLPDPTNPYAKAHANPQGYGDARPTSIQIVEGEGLVNCMGGKVMLVTGSTSGIGVDTVRALHLTGADVYMQARDLKKAEAVRGDILGTSEGKGKLEIIVMDLNSLESIREGVKDFLIKAPKLNVLVNNAGVRNTPETRTVDGFETQFGVNHLAHFLLFQLLLPILLSSSTPSFNSRVINVTSGAHKGSRIIFDNPNLEGIYNPRMAYSQSKTANILMANSIERLYGDSGVHGLSVHPGCISTNLQKYDLRTQKEKDDYIRGNPALQKVLKSTSQGAATQVWAAVGKVWEGKGGLYLEECRKGHQCEEPDILNGGYKAFVFDVEAEDKLWDMSCLMVGINK